MYYYRHGDVTLQKLPDNEKMGVNNQKVIEVSKLAVALGEVTGHSHTIIPIGDAKIRTCVGVNDEKPNPEADEILFQVFGGQAIIVHEEHEPILLDEGFYHRQMKKQFNPFTNAIEQVRD